MGPHSKSAHTQPGDGKYKSGEPSSRTNRAELPACASRAPTVAAGPANTATPAADPTAPNMDLRVITPWASIDLDMLILLLD